MKGEEWYKDEEIAESYDPKRFSGAGGRHIDRTEKGMLKKILGDVEGKKVLDVAAGTGRFSLLVAEMGAEVVSCDISGPMLDKARKKAEERGIGSDITFLKTDAENLPFEDETFDIVMSIRFAHLMDKAEPFFNEMKRVSKKRIVFDTFNFCSLRIFYNFALPMDSHLYKVSDVKSLAEDVGLDIRKREHGFVIPFGFYRYVPNLFTGLLRWFDRCAQSCKWTRKLSSVTHWSLEKK